MTDFRKQQIEQRVKEFFGPNSKTSKVILDALYQNGNCKNGSNGCNGVKKKI